MFRVMFTCGGKKRQGVSTVEGSEQVQRLTMTWGNSVVSERHGQVHLFTSPAGSELGLGIIPLLIRCRISEKNLKLFHILTLGICVFVRD